MRFTTGRPGHIARCSCKSMERPFAHIYRQKNTLDGKFVVPVHTRCRVTPRKFVRCLADAAGSGI